MAKDSGAALELARRPLADFRADRRVLVVSVMALVVGSGAVLAAWCLIALIALVTNLVWFGHLSTASMTLAHVARSPWVLLIPPAGGLVIGLMARFGSEKIRGHGIPEAIEAILIGGSRMSPKVALLKPLSSAISIGTGGPFGAEGPIIMTGGAIGSLFAQLFHLSAAERKTLLVAGAAAGMTAIFNTPAAAVLLAVELLLFEWRPRSFVPVLVAVMTTVALRPLLFASGPLFPFAVADLPKWTLIGSIGLGVVVGFSSGLLTTLLYRLEDAFERLPLHWMWWPAIGGVVVGLGGLIEPAALGVGYDVIDNLLTAHMSIQAVLLILTVKATIWLVALSSGTSGGVLAPLLILGGTIGWLVGNGLTGDPGMWALLGMAAMLGGTMRAPLTGALFATEITGELHLLPDLLAASAAAYAVTVLIMKRSILTEKIARRGHHITREYEIDPHEFTRVADVMTTEVETFSENTLIPTVVLAVAQGQHKAYPVLNAAGQPVGLVSRGDALLWITEGGHEGDRLCDLVSDASLPSLHPSDLTSRAIEIMVATESGRIPVTDDQTGRLVGLLTRKDLLRVRAAFLRTEVDREVYLMRRRGSADQVTI